jgi:hypothetical protein
MGNKKLFAISLVIIFIVTFFIGGKAVLAGWRYSSSYSETHTYSCSCDNPVPPSNTNNCSGSSWTSSSDAGSKPWYHVGSCSGEQCGFQCNANFAWCNGVCKTHECTLPSTKCADSANIQNCTANPADPTCSTIWGPATSCGFQGCNISTGACCNDAPGCTAHTNACGIVVPARPMVNGACGPAASSVYSSPPSSGLCSYGTPSGVSSVSLGRYQWTCQGDCGSSITCTTATNSKWREVTP